MKQKDLIQFIVDNFSVGSDGQLRYRWVEDCVPLLDEVGIEVIKNNNGTDYSKSNDRTTS